LQPLIAFVLAPLILGETVRLAAIVSSVLILIGVMIVTRRNRRRKEIEGTSQI
jgi:drug/metabolite transporter (DMT)-like permease